MPRPQTLRARASWLGLAALTACTAVVRAEPYAGAALGIVRQQLVCAPGAPCEKDVPASRVFVGWNFEDRFGVEFAWSGGWSDFTASDRLGPLTWSGDVSAQLLSASATWSFALRRLDLIARAGVAAVRSEFRSGTPGVPDARETKVRPMLGLAIRHDIDSRWALRADLELTEAQSYTRRGRQSAIIVGVERRF